MIGLDTNVVVRFLTGDDAMQSPRARALFEELTEAEPGFISLVTLAETHRVLTSSYGLDRATVLHRIVAVAESEEIVLQDSDLVHVALRDAGAGADLADALIGRAGEAAGCRATLTFDRRAAGQSGFELLES